MTTGGKLKSTNVFPKAVLFEKYSSYRLSISFVTSRKILQICACDTPMCESGNPSTNFNRLKSAFLGSQINMSAFSLA